MEINPPRGLSRRQNHEPSIAEQLPYIASAVSRYGQITLSRPRSSPSSAQSRVNTRQNSRPTRRKRTTKAKVKTEDSTKLEADTTTRKHKAHHKSTKSAIQLGTTSQDDKRNMLLEKNRLAAAKCRINKKEKTDQMQRSSQYKVVENTLLRQTIIHMQEEVQQLQVILMSHSYSGHCKDPESIHEAGKVAGSHGFARQIANNHFHSTQLQKRMRHLNYDQSRYGDYLQPCEAPALPGFDLPADFEVYTPALND